MSGSRELKRRIASAGSIAQITRAMESVAASKMRRAQESARSGEAYQLMLKRITENLRKFIDKESHALLTPPAKAEFGTLTIIISSDRGLCGPLNSNLFRLLEKELPDGAAVVTVGKKIAEYARKTNWRLVAAIESLGDFPDYEQVAAAGEIAIGEFLSGKTGAVLVAYQQFVNTLFQRPVIEQLLPFAIDELGIPEEVAPPKYIFEPSQEKILGELLPYSVKLSVYQSVLSAKAAEQSARMLAMKNASDNAMEVKKSLRLVYNKERQKKITSEIADVVTAGMAI